MEIETIGARRLWVLIRGLPDDSALKHQEWGWDEELAAAQIEVVDQWGRIAALIAGVKQHQLPPPVRIPRPSEETNQPKKNDPQKIAEFFGRLH